MIMKTEDVKKKLTKKKKKKKVLTKADYLSSGSTMLNLACTDFPDRCFAKGKFYLIVGDSSSGKTFLSLTCLAELMKNKNFKDYRIIYDNSEDGALMDIDKFFGSKAATKLEPPGGTRRNPKHSDSIEDFYYNVDDAIKNEKPFIYILDSMDSLTSESETSKFQEHKKAHRKGKTAIGSYGDGKAKKNSEGIRQLIAPLRNTGSILIIITQTRDNIGFGFEKKTRSGGRALRFYACLEIWSSIAGKITKTVKGKKRQLGILCKCQIKKNRLTGKDRTVVFPIYHSFGIDDIGACIDYLVSEGYWKKDKAGIITAGDFELKGKQAKIIKEIEEQGLEKDLIELVGDLWKEIEDACVVKRKKRYE